MYHFYHCYSGINSNGQEDTWRPILGKHIEALIDSGLIENIPSVQIGITSNTNNFDDVKDFIDSYSIPYNIVAESATGWEQETMSKLYDFSKTNDGYVLYAHSKGAYTDIVVNHIWRETMTYFNVSKWVDAVEKLSEYDAVGCYWLDDSHKRRYHGYQYRGHRYGYPHRGQRWFAGTFWWTKLEMLRQTNGPGNATRWDAEVWIGQIPSDKIYDLDYGRPEGSGIPE